MQNIRTYVLSIRKIKKVKIYFLHFALLKMDRKFFIILKCVKKNSLKTITFLTYLFTFIFIYNYNIKFLLE